MHFYPSVRSSRRPVRDTSSQLCPAQTSPPMAVISPEFLSGVAFGVIIVLLALLALWQNRRIRGQETTTAGPPPMLPLYYYPSSVLPPPSYSNGRNLPSPSVSIYPWLIWPHPSPNMSQIPGLPSWVTPFSTQTATHLPSRINIDMHYSRLLEEHPYVPRAPALVEAVSTRIPQQITEVEEEEE